MQSRKGLKVFVDAYLLSKEPQGTVTYLKGLYTAVTRQNPDIDFYFGCIEQVELEEFKTLENVHWIIYKDLSRVNRMLYEIPKLIEQYKFDFAHFQYVIPLKKRKKCVYINTIHDVLFIDYPQYFPFKYRLVRKLLFKRSANTCDILLTVSAYSRNAIANHFGIDKDKIKVVPNGISARYFLAYNRSEVQSEVKREFGLKNYFLMVSRIEPRKNQALLLKTFFDHKWDQAEIQLVFVGSKSLAYKELDNFLSSLTDKQKESVHFISGIDDQKLSNIYRGAEGFIYPSIAEGFGIPPLEAGACRIPVLCANGTAMEEYDFFKPYFCDVFDENEFQKAFTTFAKARSQNDLKMISSEIEKRFSWHEIAEKFSEILLKQRKN